MDIYLTDIETKDSLQIPMLPEKISVQTGALFQSYTIMSVGDVMLPTGDELDAVSWDGILPGMNRRNDPYLRGWLPPNEIKGMLDTFKLTRKKLQLMITETWINLDVYIQRFTGEYSGGYGDYSYSISLIQAKDLIVHESGQADTATEISLTKPRPLRPPVETKLITSDDSLYSIAQQEMGDGSRYPELHEANKDVIGTNPGAIKPGLTLKIPREAPKLLERAIRILR